MKTKQAIAIAALLGFLTACGDSKTDRALSGAGIGAAAGGVGSAVLGGDAVTGAVVGGAVGAAAGGLTDRDDIRGESPPPGRAAARSGARNQYLRNPGSGTGTCPAEPARAAPQ